MVPIGLIVKLIVTIYEYTPGPKKPALPTTRPLQARFKSQFAAHKPKSIKPRDQLGWHHAATWQIELTPEAADQLLPNLRKFLASVPKTKSHGAVLAAELSASDIKRARFLPLYFPINADEENDEPLNRRVKLCETCWFPDLGKVAKPYRVASIVAKKRKIDTFGAATGHVMIVRKHVLDLLSAVILDQIDSGPAQLESGKKTDAFWVLPRFTVGPDAKLYVEKRCPKCKRPNHAHYNPPMSDRRQNVAFNDWRKTLAHFGDHPQDRPLDIARLDQMLGYPESSSPRIASYGTDIVISGALATYLRDNDVTGFNNKNWGEGPDVCYFSAKNEPAFEPAPRKLGQSDPKAQAKLDATRADREKRLDQSRAQMQQFKDLPWDHKHDSYIYFHLSTPNLVLADPMSGTSRTFKLPSFKPGLHRLPVSAIRPARGNAGVDVDSASLVFLDEDFHQPFTESFDWDKLASTRKPARYLQKIADQLGTRFGYCTAPGLNSPHPFTGDGTWTIAVTQVQRVT